MLLFAENHCTTLSFHVTSPLGCKWLLSRVIPLSSQFQLWNFLYGSFNCMKELLVFNINPLALLISTYSWTRLHSGHLGDRRKWSLWRGGHYGDVGVQYDNLFQECTTCLLCQFSCLLCPITVIQAQKWYTELKYTKIIWIKSLTWPNELGSQHLF